MIKLNRHEIQFMLEKLELKYDLQIFLGKMSSSDIICDSVADELRDLCTDRLDLYGFDINYNLTEEGKMLQSLIDKLYVD